MVPSPRGDQPNPSQPALPPSALDEFARRVKTSPVRARLDAAAVEVLDALESSGVDALLLKGPALARTLYAPSEHRGYNDVDVLVPPGGVPSARETLRALGYTSMPDQLGIDEIGRGMDGESWTRPTPAGEAVVLIDLHQQISGCEGSPDAVWETLHARHGWIELEGRRVPALDSEGLAVHVALHVAQHGDRYPKPLEDLARAIDRWPQEVWEGATGLADELDATAAFAAGLRQLPQGVALAERLGLPTTEELDWAITHRYKRPRGTFHLDALGQAATLGERASLLRRALFPRPGWIAWQYPWASDHGVRMLCGYAAHLARAPLWAVRAWRFRRRARRGESLV